MYQLGDFSPKRRLFVAVYEPNVVPGSGHAAVLVVPPATVPTCQVAPLRQGTSRLCHLRFYRCAVCDHLRPTSHRRHAVHQAVSPSFFFSLTLKRELSLSKTYINQNSTKMQDRSGGSGAVYPRTRLRTASDRQHFYM